MVSVAATFLITYRLLIGCADRTTILIKKVP
jgi:hypothetical protein